MTTALSNRVSRALQPLLDPFAGLQKEMDDLLNRFQSDWSGDRFPAITVPAADLSETDDSLQIRMDMPGLKAEEINIEVSGNTIRITGEHKEEKEEKGKTYHRIERRSGSFARAMTLPAQVKEDKVTAECKDGVLTITLPKTETAKTHRVTVKNNGK
ncbi:MAG: Hsp20/alpha crystallin family protein [Planctomycetaceae bacterium]